MRKRKLVALVLISYRCIVTVNVLWLFLMVLWDGLQSMIVVFLIILTYLCGSVQIQTKHRFMMSPLLTIISYVRT